MKHKLPIILIILTLFLATQIIGLFITQEYLTQAQLPLGIERPEFETTGSYFSLLVGLVIVIALALFIIKVGAMKIWRIWFFLASAYLLTIAFGAFFAGTYALIIALLFTTIRFIRPSVIIHNFSELFVYSGIAAIFVPIMSFLAVSILLIVISIYDMIAVWKTKHMIKIAEFQAQSKMFAGLFIPYKQGKKQAVAILGGGDIGFTMLFAGVVMKTSGMLDGIIVAVCVTLALASLLLFAKNKYYPAMPYLTAGCAIGYLITLLV